MAFTQHYFKQFYLHSSCFPEKFDFFIRHVTSSGLPNRWTGNLGMPLTRDGKKFANLTKDKIDVYGGHVEEKGEDENSIIMLQLKLSCIFFVFTLCVFLAELVTGKSRIELRLENLLIVVAFGIVNVVSRGGQGIIYFCCLGRAVWRWLGRCFSDPVNAFKAFKC